MEILNRRKTDTPLWLTRSNALAAFAFVVFVPEIQEERGVLPAHDVRPEELREPTAHITHRPRHDDLLQHVLRIARRRTLRLIHAPPFLVAQRHDLEHDVADAKHLRVRRLADLAERRARARAARTDVDAVVRRLHERVAGKHLDERRELVRRRLPALLQQRLEVRGRRGRLPAQSRRREFAEGVWGERELRKVEGEGGVDVAVRGGRWW